MIKRPMYGYIALIFMLALSAFVGYQVWLDDTLEVCQAVCTEEKILMQGRIIFGLTAGIFTFVGQAVIALVTISITNRLRRTGLNI